MDENSLAQLYDDYNDGINVLEGESVTDYITRMGGVNYNSKADGGIMVAIENFNQGGMAGNKTYHQFHDQYVPMDEESMGYAYGGGVGSMMQPRQNFAVGGGADFIGLNPNDTSIDVENLQRTNDGELMDAEQFLVSAADGLKNQNGTIDSMPSITNRDLRTIEGSLIDGDDPSSRYAVQQDFKSDRPFDRDYSLFDLARMGQQDLEITDRNRGQIIERTPSTPFDRGFTMRDVAGELPERFNGSFSPNQGDVPYSPNNRFSKYNKFDGSEMLEGVDIDGKPEGYETNSPNNRFSRYNKFDGSEMLEGVGIDGKPEGYETNRFDFKPSQGNAPLTGMKQFYPNGMTYEQLVDLGLAGEDQDVGLTAIDLEKQRSRNPFNKIMEFMGNIPTPFNLARKGLEAIAGPRRETTGTVYSDSGQAYTPAQLNRMNAKGGYYSEPAREQRRRESRVQNMLDRKAAGKSYSQKNLNELTTGGSKPGTYTTKGSGSAGSPSGGKSIVCTAMYQTTGLQDWSKAMKVWYIYQKRHLSDAHQEGYHLLFKPFVKGMHKSKIIRAIGAHVAKHRTQELKHIMFNSKSDTLGKIYNKILQPICYLAGKIKSIFS